MAPHSLLSPTTPQREHRGPWHPRCSRAGPWLCRGGRWPQPWLTRMMLWQVWRGSPTRLVPLTDMRRSPMLSSPDLSAGPPCIRLAMTTVGRMEPQPDSTTAMPRISPFCFRMQTWGAQTGYGHLSMLSQPQHGCSGLTATRDGSQFCREHLSCPGSCGSGGTELPASSLHCPHPSKASLTSLQFSCREKWFSSALYCSWSSRARLYWRGLSWLGSMLFASRKRW